MAEHPSKRMRLEELQYGAAMAVMGSAGHHQQYQQHYNTTANDNNQLNQQQQHDANNEQQFYQQEDEQQPQQQQPPPQYQQQEDEPQQSQQQQVEQQQVEEECAPLPMEPCSLKRIKDHISTLKSEASEYQQLLTNKLLQVQHAEGRFEIIKKQNRLNRAAARNNGTSTTNNNNNNSNNGISSNITSAVSGEGRQIIQRGRICSAEGCNKFAQRDGVCNAHGANLTARLCTAEGCTNHAKRGGVCKRHMQKLLCSTEGCNNVARLGGASSTRTCEMHGPTKPNYRRLPCIHEGCTNQRKRAGYCAKHDPEKAACNFTWDENEGDGGEKRVCKNQAVMRGKCVKHDAEVRGDTEFQCTYEGGCTTYLNKRGAICRKHSWKKSEAREAKRVTICTTIDCTIETLRGKTKCAFHDLEEKQNRDVEIEAKKKGEAVFTCNWEGCTNRATKKEGLCRIHEMKMICGTS